jgi:putative resolvase
MNPFDIRAFLSVGDAAALLGVHTDTLRRWEKVGRLTGYRTPGGHRRYAVDELESILTEPADPAESAADPDPDE